MSESSEIKINSDVKVVGVSVYHGCVGIVTGIAAGTTYPYMVSLRKPSVTSCFAADDLELVDGTPFDLWDDDIKVQEDLPEKFQRESVLQEAERLINGQRQSDYGHPIDNFTQTGRMWGAILNIPDIPAETVGLMMVAAKVSRETNVHKRDNLVDMAGYAGTIEKIVSRRAAGLDDDAD